MEERQRILIVDDEQSIRSFLFDTLSGEYDIDQAADGEEGAARAMEGDYAVALLDIRMPGLEGVEVLKRIRESTGTTEVVMLTAYASMDTVVEALRLGAFDYLTKPSKPADIRRVVRHAAEKSRLTRENRRLIENLRQANRQLEIHVQHVQKLNQMSERINEENLEMTARLRSLNEELERKVESATLELSRMNRILADNYLSTITALASSIEMKDTYTRGHSVRVARYTVAVAERMGLNDQLEVIKYATILHDIGKIGIREEILTKAAALTDEEYETIKLHPQMGARTVQTIDFLRPVLSIVRNHHERWDGKGYPDGMGGEEIPLEARIVAVADAFDAMVSHRAYRENLSRSEAFVQLREGAGSQFDRHVVEVFLEVMR